MTYCIRMKIWATAICLSVASGTLHGAPPKSPKHGPSIPPIALSQRADATSSPLIDGPLHLSDFPNMQPRPDLRVKLASVSNFIQNQPVDGQPATEATVVWSAHTLSTLYFVFICHDRHPNLIRGHLARRENILSDDSVAI